MPRSPRAPPRIGGPAGSPPPIESPRTTSELRLRSTQSYGYRGRSAPVLAAGIPLGRATHRILFIIGRREARLFHLSAPSRLDRIALIGPTPPTYPSYAPSFHRGAASSKLFVVDVELQIPDGAFE
jgi:hypothetical protein